MEYTEYFAKYPDAYDKIEAVMDREHTLYDHLQGLGLFDGAPSVLSVGAGSALVELRAARELGLRLGVVEPTEHFYRQFEAGVEKHGLRDRILESRMETFQDYASERRYGLVLFLYSWYSFGLDAAILEKALACRAPGGALVIHLTTENSFPCLIPKAYSQAAGITLSSEGISNWARQLGHAHEYAIYDGLVPAETYRKGDELTPSGRDMVSYLTATPWEDVPIDTRHLSRLILQSCEFEGQSHLTSGTLIFRDSATP
ncbi:MAG: class I SAM-dependent methyltransferase [Verrucomicrobiota bacterium]